MKIGNIELLNCDNMAFMATVPDKHFDLAIVDPPYGIENEISKGGGSHTKSSVTFHQLYSENNKKWDIKPQKEYFEELKRVSKNQIIWGGNYFAELGSCRCFICWDKVRYVPNFSMAEYAWTSFDKPAKLFSYCNNAGFVLKPCDKKIHPTQKPVQLYKWLLKTFGICEQCENEGRVIDDDFTKETIPCETCKGSFKILDTHLGSGSIAIACHDYKFELTGCEIDKDYFDASVKRLQNHVAQTVLF